MHGPLGDRGVPQPRAKALVDPLAAAEPGMKITRLPAGEAAPSDVDCIRIEERPDGTYTMTASALCSSANDGDSVSIVDVPAFESVQEAEDAGLAWADNVGSEQLYILIGTLDRPLKPAEIDLPL
jgi:hypothetical protein